MRNDMDEKQEILTFTWRATRRIRDWLENSARESNRSMNAQLNEMIEKAMQKEEEEKKAA